jgi:hypothetical protein
MPKERVGDISLQWNKRSDFAELVLHCDENFRFEDDEDNYDRLYATINTRFEAKRLIRAINKATKHLP